jgi:dipeptidyl aminopeptidase/acylaminoacyl peptidase
MKRPIEPGDFSRYRCLSRPEFSPDASKIVFSIQQANMEENQYDSDVAVVESDGSAVTRLSYGGKDSSPRFSPDGSTVAFLSRRGMGKEDKGNELYIISLDEKEPRRLLRREEGLESPSFSADSKLIYFLGKVISDKDNDDPKVVTRVPLWYNGVGFAYNFRKHLFSLDIVTGDLIQITSGEFDVSTLRPSRNGRQIGYLASPDDMHSFIKDLFVVDDTSKVVKLTNSDMSISDFDWSPDDSSIAFNGRDVSRGLTGNSRIFVLKSNGGDHLSKVEDTDLNKSNSLNSDARISEGAGRVVWDGEFVYYLQAEGAYVRIYRVKPGTRPELIVSGDRSVDDFDVKRNRIAFVAMNSAHLQELSILENEEKRLTSFNQRVLQEFDIAAQEAFSFRASDGATVEGWVLAKKREGKLPTIVYVHGGPKTAFGESYMHEFQVFASKGYAVLYSNIRGSAGYSANFADIRHHFGERDFKDLIEMIEYATGKFPFLNKDRMAIAGGSYGGFMTNWAIAHTNVFKAAVTDRSISSWRSSFWTADSPEIAKELLGDPFQDANALDTMSPLTYAENIRTPLLIVHSMEDYRCPMTEGLQLFTALKYLGKNVELVLFPGENHDLSRNGKPKHRVARLNHYLRWFDKYLKDQ